MKRFFQWLFIFLFLCSASVFDVAAQIVMEKGADNPVIYAHVINEKGEFLGLTDTEGRLPELKESKTLNISHVAYNPVTVEVGKLPERIDMAPISFEINEAVVQIPKPYCIRLTGFLRNYFLSSADDPVSEYYDGITELYFFLNNSKKEPEWMDLVARDGKTGKMVASRKDRFVLLPENKSYIEMVRSSKRHSLEGKSNYRKILHKKDVVGNLSIDTTNHVLFTNFDLIAPDTVKTINMLLAKFRFNEAKASSIYSYDDLDYISQSHLQYYSLSFRCKTRILKMNIDMRGVIDFRTAKAEYLTEEQYKQAKKSYKARKKSKASMTSEELDQYIIDHHIPDIPKELKRSLAISKKLNKAKK